MAIGDFLPSDVASAIDGVYVNPGAAEADIHKAMEAIGVSPPADYVRFMTQSDGAEFWLSEEAYVVLFSLDRTRTENDGRRAEDGFPQHLKAFGGNGASERFAFDSRIKPHPIVMLPTYQPQPDDPRPQGTTLVELLRSRLKGE